MALAAYDLSQQGSSTLSAPFCVVTSLPHCDRNAGSCTDGYTTVTCININGTIGSRDYCHALLGVSPFFFRHTKLWEMTTVVDKMACSPCRACPLPIVLRSFIADTVSSATVCR